VSQSVVRPTIDATSFGVQHSIVAAKHDVKELIAALRMKAKARRMRKGKTKHNKEEDSWEVRV
jgi:hypothetical protein